MSHGKFEAKRKPFPIALWVILILALLGTSFGGVRAYLSASAGSVANQFTAAQQPQVSVDSDNKVTVTIEGSDYAVYLRAAVVVNWQNSNGNILAAAPSEFSVTPGTNWFPHSDGFYYYKMPVTSGTVNDPVIAAFSASTTREGYKPVANIAVQAVQAVGTADSGNIPAVQDAWGITPEQIQNGTSTN